MAQVYALTCCLKSDENVNVFGLKRAALKFFYRLTEQLEPAVIQKGIIYSWIANRVPAAVFLNFCTAFLFYCSVWGVPRSDHGNQRVQASAGDV